MQGRRPHRGRRHRDARRALDARDRGRDPESDEAQRLPGGRPHGREHLLGQAVSPRLLPGLVHLGQHAALRGQGGRELRALFADEHQHEVAGDRLPPPREARAGHRAATPAEAGPVFVVGRGIVLGDLQQQLGAAGQGEGGGRVRRPHLEVQAACAQDQDRLVQAALRLDRPVGRGPPPGGREHESRAEGGCQHGVRLAVGGVEGLGHEAEVGDLGRGGHLQGRLAHVLGAGDADLQGPRLRPHGLARHHDLQLVVDRGDDEGAGSPDQDRVAEDVALEAAAPDHYHVAGGGRGRLDLQHEGHPSDVERRRVRLPSPDGHHGGGKGAGPAQDGGHPHADRGLLHVEHLRRLQAEPHGGPQPPARPREHDLVPRHGHVG